MTGGACAREHTHTQPHVAYHTNRRRRKSMRTVGGPKRRRRCVLAVRTALHLAAQTDAAAVCVAFSHHTPAHAAASTRRNGRVHSGNGGSIAAPAPVSPHTDGGCVYSERPGHKPAGVRVSFRRTAGRVRCAERKPDRALSSRACHTVTGQCDTIAVVRGLEHSLQIDVRAIRARRVFVIGEQRSPRRGALDDGV